jgi:predicted ester cyclase
MKKLFYSLLAAFAIIVASCSTKKENTMSATATKNLEAMKGVVKCFESKDFSKLGDYVAEDCIDHYWDRELKGLKEMKAEYEKWIGMSDNSPIRTVTEFANDEYVILWTSFEETMKTTDMNMKVGEKLKKTDIEIGRFKDGKIVEHWTYIEPAAMLKMMPQTGSEKK